MEDELKKLLSLMTSLIDSQRKNTPKYIKVNQEYLNTLIKTKEVVDISVDSEGDISIDCKSFTEIPVIIDNTIDTFKLEI
jgi:hypothetical protein